jgi:hypothetical protein
MEEEQMTYARSHVTHQPPPTQAARQAETQQQEKQTNFARQHQGYPPVRQVYPPHFGVSN